MAAGLTCALPGCSKPPFPSPDGATPHLACGNLHHQLLMAVRFNPALPHPHQHILDRNAVKLCALSSCRNPPHPGHSWCSRTHYLCWLSDFTSTLQPNQICKLPGCTRHVFVDDNFSPSQFCGWRHCQKYVMLSAQQHQHQQLPQQQSLPSPSVAETLKHECGNVPSVELLVHSLRDYALSTNPPKNIKVDDDFFDRHPWEVCTVRCKYTSKGSRVMVTKDDYHWKQQGRRVCKGNYTLKYFTYKKLKGKEQNAVVERRNRCSYFMEEHTTEGVKDFSLVKLRKSIDGRCKHHKGRPAADGKQSCTEANDACSQNTLMQKSDEMSVESFLLSLLHDSPSDTDEGTRFYA